MAVLSFRVAMDALYFIPQSFFLSSTHTSPYVEHDARLMGVMTGGAGQPLLVVKWIKDVVLLLAYFHGYKGIHLLFFKIMLIKEFTVHWIMASPA